MEMVTEVEDMSGSDLLDRAGHLAGTRNRCEVEIVRVAVQHALLNNPDTLDPTEAARPGRERARRCGGEGTPEVGEFAAAELGARLGMSTVSAWLLMCDGLDLVYRLPRLWARVEAGQVRVYLARLVARRTRHLTEQQAGYVDARITPYADGRVTYSRFQALVEGVVAAADPQGTAAAERKAAEEPVACRTRPDPEHDHGMWGFYIKAPARTVLVFDAALSRIATILKDLGSTDTVDQRRVTALLVLSRPDLAAQLITAYRSWSDRPADPAGDPPPDPDDPEPPQEAPQDLREAPGPWSRQARPTGITRARVSCGGPVTSR